MGPGLDWGEWSGGVKLFAVDRSQDLKKVPFVITGRTGVFSNLDCGQRPSKQAGAIVGSP
jgi:hypothetical protein